MPTPPKTSEQNMLVIQHQNPEYYPECQNDEIDLIQLLLNLKARWKLILSITLIGTGLSVLFALSQPKVYRASVVLSLPSQAEITKVNINGSRQYTQQSLFNEYYNMLRSENSLKQYVFEQGYLQKLYPEKYSEQTAQVLFAKLVKDFNIKIIEPAVGKGEFVAEPTRVSVTLMHQNEIMIVELLNNYHHFVNQNLQHNFSSAQSAERTDNLRNINQKIALLEQDAKTKRLLLIDKIEAQNSEKIALLEQRKLLLIKKAGLDRATQISQSQESLAMAKKLDIINPTRLDDINKERDSDGMTNITLSSEQTLPLYLMGSKYLKSQIESLKNRKSDELFLTEVNALNIEIEAVKNDQKLKALKERQSDRPFIDQLPSLLNSIEVLNVLTLDFNDLKASSQSKMALLINKAIKPNRPFIIVIGGILSLFLAIVITLFVVALDNRKRVVE